MASIYRLRKFVVVCFLFLLHSKEGAALTWANQPTSATEIQGRSVSITWTANMGSGETWNNVRVSQEVEGLVNKQPMIIRIQNGVRSIYDGYKSRDADLNLTASLSGTLLTSVFTMRNLNRSTDEHLYALRITFTDTIGVIESRDSADVSLKVLVPTVITSPNPKIVTVNESNIARLECTVEGYPPPHVNWTRNGVFLGTGSGVYNTPTPVEMSDDKTCYTCIAYNGVLDAKTANVCLNVQYKPRNASIESDRSTVCQNDKVNLTCTSGPANPAPSSYEFYNNGFLIGTSASNVYEATATAGLPDVNKFVCVPRNLVGGSLKNGSVVVKAKVAPTVTQTLGNSQTVVEGSNVTLACSASGTPPLNVTWTRTGKPDVSGLQYPIIGIKRGDAGLYQCTVNNGAECPPNTAGINVIVNYKPESTNLTYTPSSEKFCQGNQINLTCAAHGKPVAEYSLYRNNQLVQSGSTTGVFNVQLNEKGDNTFTCVPNNIVGAGQNNSIQVFVKEAPTIVTVPQNTNLKEGSTLTLFCNASGLPAPNITWTKVGGSNVGSTETFTISSITRGQEGIYRCTASNGDECSNASADANVVVNYKPENTRLTASRTTGCVSDSLTLTCDTSAKPAPSKYRFFRNDVLIISHDTKAYTFPMSVSGANVYKCQPENIAGNGTDSNVTVNVKAAPVIDFVTPSQELIEGNSLTLVCNVTDSSGQLNVSWHKVGGDELSSNSTYTIASVGRNDAGSYQCKAHNGNECDAKTKLVDVTVKYPAAITSHSSLTVRANENDMVTLKCTVSGSPTPKVNWTRDGQQITGKHGQTYSFNAMESLSGNYSCVVSNGVGDVQRKTFDVKITGYCKNHKCRYGGTCRSKGVGYRCLCTRGLIGKFCEFEDPITSEFDCLLVIVNPDWVPEYGDKKSSKHNELENKICNKMFRIFNGRPPAIPGRNLVTCALLDTRQGSIISNTLLTFNGSVLRSEVLNAIQDSVVNETIFGNLTLKASSIQVEPKRDPCSSDPCKFDGNCEVQGNGYRCECGSFRYGMHCEKGIGLIPGLIIILACILIIIIIIILCVLYCKRKKSETYPSAGAENGTQMKTYTLSDHNAAAVNPHVITADEKPPVRNGQPVETYRQNGKDEVVYADLSFKTFDNKEKKDVEKLPQQSETVYADIVSFQQNTDEKPKQDATLDEEAIELTEKDPTPEPEKQTEVEDQDEGSKQTDNVADSQGGDETPENPKTDGYSTSPLVRLV